MSRYLKSYLTLTFCLKADSAVCLKPGSHLSKTEANTGAQLYQRQDQPVHWPHIRAVFFEERILHLLHLHDPFTLFLPAGGNKEHLVCIFIIGSFPCIFPRQIHFSCWILSLFWSHIGKIADAHQFCFTVFPTFSQFKFWNLLHSHTNSWMDESFSQLKFDMQVNGAGHSWNWWLPTFLAMWSHRHKTTFPVPWLPSHL